MTCEDILFVVLFGQKTFVSGLKKEVVFSLVYQQGLSCSLYAQPLKEAQENYQRYALKDNLS